LQKLELLRREVNLPLADAYLARGVVDGQRAGPDDQVGVRLAGPAQQGADSAAS
jgi:hypothetical protein